MRRATLGGWPREDLTTRDQRSTGASANCDRKRRVRGSRDCDRTRSSWSSGSRVLEATKNAVRSLGCVVDSDPWPRPRLRSSSSSRRSGRSPASLPSWTELAGAAPVLGALESRRRLLALQLRRRRARRGPEHAADDRAPPRSRPRAGAADRRWSKAPPGRLRSSRECAVRLARPRTRSSSPAQCVRAAPARRRSC
jgi:hypothetical protein